MIRRRLYQQQFIIPGWPSPALPAGELSSIMPFMTIRRFLPLLRRRCPRGQFPFPPSFITFSDQHKHESQQGASFFSASRNQTELGYFWCLGLGLTGHHDTTTTWTRRKLKPCLGLPLSCLSLAAMLGHASMHHRCHGLDGLVGLDSFFFLSYFAPSHQQATDPLNNFCSLFARHAIQFKEA